MSHFFVRSVIKVLFILEPRDLSRLFYWKGERETLRLLMVAVTADRWKIKVYVEETSQKYSEFCRCQSISNRIEQRAASQFMHE